MSNIIYSLASLGPACTLALGTTSGHVRPSPDRDIVLLGGDPFNLEQYIAELLDGGVDGLDLSDKPFYPEIHYDGKYYPICGIDFNDEAATMACRDIDRFHEDIPKDYQQWWHQERFTYGGRVVKTNVILEHDAMPVGACLRGESLDGCTAGGNAFGDFESFNGRCKKGNPVGVQIVCQRQCRKFGERVFLDEHRAQVELMGLPMTYEPFYFMDACGPFLKNTTSYYLADETFAVDNPYFSTLISQFGALLDEMGQKCAANVVELICHTVFKECKEIDFEDPLTGGVSSTMLPSLLCKSECERHKAMWDECYASIQNDVADKELFGSNMRAMSNLMAGAHKELTGTELPAGPDGTRSPFSLLDCQTKGGQAAEEIPDEDVAASWILGCIFQTNFDYASTQPVGMLGWAFPRFMSSEMLYPEEFSTYTGPDGVSYDVPCTIPGEAKREEFTCAHPFTPSVLPETTNACVHVCPMGQFSQDEYTTMWAVFVAIGMFSLVLNMFMVATWKLNGEFWSTPYQLKASVFLGLCYGMVETIPTLVLKFDLPCTQLTEEDIGSNPLCYLNRSGQYMLLGIMTNLCALTIMIYRALVNSTHFENNTYVNAFATTVPFLFMTIAYVLDTDDEDADNYYLNVSRHGFNCSMRFSTMLEEWMVLWLPFCASCLLTAVFSFLSWRKLGALLRSFGISLRGADNGLTEGQKKLAAQRRRLIQISATVTGCLVFSLALIGQATVEQAAWTDYEEKKLDCFIKTAGTRDYQDYGFNERDIVENVCQLPDRHRCSLESALILRDHPVDGASSFTATCGWYPARRTGVLVCNTDDLEDLYQDSEHFSDAKLYFDETHLCDCTCSDIFYKMDLG